MPTHTPPLRDDDRRWRSVLARDRRSDGAFVYAVRSTGIYCRPSCPSRRPDRGQVAFYPVPEAAERAGYRACKRCRPEEAPAAARRLDVVRRVCAAIHARDDGIPTLSELGQEVMMSPHHLQRTFKDVIGISPRAYGEAVRLERVKTALKEGEPVAMALYGAGYGSSSRLYEKAPEQLGMTPASYAKGGRGAAIAFTVRPTALGRLLVAATERGVAAVMLGETDAELEAELRRDFPLARVQRDDGPLDEWVGAILEHLDGHQPHLSLPLDIRATAFQWRVWQALRAIPTGETRSYKEIAEAIGSPGAARAVGRACATNPVSLVVPCHRAVGSGGNLSGYRWGVERKRQLLERERSATPAAGRAAPGADGPR